MIWAWKVTYKKKKNSKLFYLSQNDDINWKKLMHWCTWYTRWVCSIITRKTEGSLNIQMFFRRTGELYLVVLCGTQSFFCFLFFFSNYQNVDWQPIREWNCVYKTLKVHTTTTAAATLHVWLISTTHTHTHKHILQPIDGVYCYPGTCWGFWLG